MTKFAHAAMHLHNARAVAGPRSLMPTRHNICDARIAHALRAGSAIVNSTACALARLLAITAAIFTLAVLLPSTLSAQPASDPPLPSSLIVKLASGLSADDQAAVIDRNGGIQVSAIPALRLHVVEVPTDQLDQILANYRADPQVVRAEVNNTRKATAIPSDPLYPNQWALPRINWDLVFGNAIPSASVIVAVLDTGIDAIRQSGEGDRAPLARWPLPRRAGGMGRPVPVLPLVIESEFT